MKLYIYTYATYYYDQKGNVKQNPRLKIGQTDGDVDERIKKQTTSSPEPPLVLWTQDIGDKTDKDIHAALIEKGYKPANERNSGGGVEWFDVDFEVVKQTVTEVAGKGGFYGDDKWKFLWMYVWEKLGLGLFYVAKYSILGVIWCVEGLIKLLRRKS